MSASSLNYLLSAEELSTLAFLHDLDCPRYVEKEIVRLRVIRFPNYSVCLHGELMVEKRVSDLSSALTKDRHLHNIKLLHCLNGTTGIPRFYGIVTSQCGWQLKSYLFEGPGHRKICDVIVCEKSNGSLKSWLQREKWAKQIIQAVKDIHTKGFVIGILGYPEPLIYLDEQDNAKICAFAPSFASYPHFDTPPRMLNGVK